MDARRWALDLEHAWDAARLRRRSGRPPENFRIETYLGFGGPGGVDRRRPGARRPAAVRRRSTARGSAPSSAAALRRVRHRRAARRPAAGHVGDTTVETDERRRRLLPGPVRARRRPTGPWLDGTVELGGGLPRPHRPAHHAGPDPGPRPGRAVRHRLRHRRHDPRDRRAAGRADGAHDVHRLGADPDAVPRRPRALPRPRRRREPGLLRLVQPVEPLHFLQGVPPGARLPARAGAAPRPARHPRGPGPQARADRGGARAATRSCRSC